MPPAAPLLEPFDLPGWRVVVGSLVGRHHQLTQDAWAIEPSLVVQGAAFHAVAVFDGVGGAPRGREAALAAAAGLGDALLAGRTPQDVLQGLNLQVLSTGGATTAVIALLPEDGDGGWLAAAGDSCVYALDGPDEARALLERDRAGSHHVTDHLGHRACRGHVRALGDRDRLLLCSDGVDDVAGIAAVAAALGAPRHGMEAAVAELLRLVVEAGVPDDATALLAIRDAF